MVRADEDGGARGRSAFRTGAAFVVAVALTAIWPISAGAGAQTDAVSVRVTVLDAVTLEPVARARIRIREAGQRAGFRTSGEGTAEIPLDGDVGTWSEVVVNAPGYGRRITYLEQTDAPYDRQVMLNPRGEDGLDRDFLTRVWALGKEPPNHGLWGWPRNTEPVVLVVDRRVRVVREGEVTEYHFGDRIPREWFLRLRRAVRQDVRALSGGEQRARSIRPLSAFAQGEVVGPEELPSDDDAIVVYFVEPESFVDRALGGIAFIRGRSPHVISGCSTQIRLDFFEGPTADDDAARSLLSHEIAGHCWMGMKHLGGSRAVPRCSIMGCVGPRLDWPYPGRPVRPTEYDLLTARYAVGDRSIGALGAPHRDVDPDAYPELSGLYPDGSPASSRFASAPRELTETTVLTRVHACSADGRDVSSYFGEFLGKTSAEVMADVGRRGAREALRRQR